MAKTRTPHVWTARKLCVWSNKHSHGAEIYLVKLDDPREPEYVGSYAASLKPGSYDKGYRLFRASYARDTVRGIQEQLEERCGS